MAERLSLLRSILQQLLSLQRAVRSVSTSVTPVQLVRFFDALKVEYTLL